MANVLSSNRRRRGKQKVHLMEKCRHEKLKLLNVFEKTVAFIGGKQRFCDLFQN